MCHCVLGFIHKEVSGGVGFGFFHYPLPDMEAGFEIAVSQHGNHVIRPCLFCRQPVVACDRCGGTGISESRVAVHEEHPDTDDPQFFHSG